MSPVKLNLQKLPPLPSKTKQRTELISWLLKVESAAKTALDNSEQIVASFREAGIYPFNSHLITGQLRDGSLAEEARRSFPLGSKILSDPLVQSGWRCHLKLPEGDDDQELETVRPISIQAEIDEADPFLEAHQLALRKRLMFPTQDQDDDDTDHLLITETEARCELNPTCDEKTPPSSAQQPSTKDNAQRPVPRARLKMIRDDDEEDPIPQLPTKTKRQESTKSTFLPSEKLIPRHKHPRSSPSLGFSKAECSSKDQGGRAKHSPEWYIQFG
ncbi:hypothetical protein BLNAU_21424 [Blattamonas nauphoetae]|uniref:Uncharacterized protein n=1 Tax=Blattamonas nauphoetae TaxID=2049346 RepID=A0ABQ9WZ37_9EUKA|nr:hypothetical protein BLNAU_21424 [Blattamonas nauphoetae]